MTMLFLLYDPAAGNIKTPSALLAEDENFPWYHLYLPHKAASLGPKAPNAVTGVPVAAYCRGSAAPLGKVFSLRVCAALHRTAALLAERRGLLGFVIAFSICRLL